MANSRKGGSGSSRRSSIVCSFCGSSPDDGRRIITGPDVYICEECVSMCSTVLSEQHTSDDAGLGFTLDSLPTPHKIKEELDKYVIGQDDVKVGVSVAAYNHYKRILSRGNSSLSKKMSDVEIEKSNVLLIGPTGTGKTLIAQTLAKMLKVPFSIVDATIFTEAGYVGEDVENMLVRLLQAADYDVSKAERGIIYIDEFDKITRKSANASITRDVSGEGVQQAMLKILEGTVSNVPPKGGRKHPEQKLIPINTRDILFICGGAFVGIEDIIEQRVGESRMGFNAKVVDKSSTSVTEKLKMVEPDDIIHFGIIPELVGRIPAVFSLEDLDEDALLKVLTEPRNSLIKQYEKLFAIEGVKLTFARDALKEVVKIAIEKNTGARGLRAVMERTLLPVMYDVPSHSNIDDVLISKKVVLGSGKATYRRAKKKSA